ncbi:MAG TPA: penicillin-binding protein [Tenuifilum sp.]|uniref:penicillin-binding protein n=1 Tax=Tenuifilum sp. TaxID=2760880 RepID=UPI002C8FD598|nr:penicillin-binding protein [Tenuifilum sp.]HQG73366.1 penicillin-binding protein [Tenuifilum sp.]
MTVKNNILIRIAGIYILLLLVGIGIVFKIVFIQVVDGHELREKAKKITYRDILVEANRGDILAADGRVLATSVPYFDLRMDLLAAGLTDSVFKANIDSLAICLSQFFGDRSWYSYRSELTNARKYAKNRRYYPIAPRKVNYLELQEISKFPLLRLGENKGGFIAEQVNKRMLPHNSMAARTLGMVNLDGGVVGIEKALDPVLRGRNGLRVHARIPGNTWVEVNSMNKVEPEDGVDILTTLDVQLQDVAEAALRKHLEGHGAGHGCAIVMEVATGDIKAIANLRRNEDGTYEEVYNYAVGESTEPGSTIKTATLIALLEEGDINLNDTVNTGKGKLQLYDHVISDSKEDGHGKITVKEVFEVSSNVGVIKLVQKVFKGKEKDFVKKLYELKLNEPTGIIIPGEVKPQIRFPGDKGWSGLSMPMMSIGYEIRLTPLQILTFYNAIANNGRMVKPRLVKAYLKHGQVVESFPPQVIQSSICSRSTLKKVHEVLEGVVESGTATNLKNPRYKIAGKTGTAQIAKGRKGYKSGGRVSYQASFVGYFPAEDPKYSCIVVVNSPSNSVYYGNVVAGPIFKEISDKVFATSPEWFSDIKDDELKDLPQTKTGQLSKLEYIMNELDIPFESNGKKTDWVTVQRDSTKIATTPIRLAKSRVPNVVGMGLRDAIYQLERLGLRVVAKGRGTVRSQSVNPGEPVIKGSTVYLEMSRGES